MSKKKSTDAAPEWANLYDLPAPIPRGMIHQQDIRDPNDEIADAAWHPGKAARDSMNREALFEGAMSTAYDQFAKLFAGAEPLFSLDEERRRAFAAGAEAATAHLVGRGQAARSTAGKRTAEKRRAIPSKDVERFHAYLDAHGNWTKNTAARNFIKQDRKARGEHLLTAEQLGKKVHALLERVRQRSTS